MRFAIAAGVVVASVAAAAQTSPQKTRGTDVTAQPVTVTGCLQAAPDQRTFTLTTSDTAASTAASGAAAASGANGPNAQIKTITYSLTPQTSVDLKSHVGHTVQVTGTAPPAQDEVSTSTHDTAATTGTAGQPGKAKVETTAKADIVAKRLNVSAVKMVSSQCSIAR